MPWRAFTVEPTGVAQTWLRRYASDTKCPHPPRGEICEAKVVYEKLPEPWSHEKGHWLSPDQSLAPSHEDERWPTACDGCGRAFGDFVPFQLLSRQLYRAGDGREWIVDELPPGAMFYSEWAAHFGLGPDGKSLVIALPPGITAESRYVDLWQIDGPSSSGGGWQREGTPPNITATPSILTSRYHGFLTAGFLTDSLGDRPMAPGPD